MLLDPDDWIRFGLIWFACFATALSIVYAAYGFAGDGKDKK
jgi:hypothetical protein